MGWGEVGRSEVGWGEQDGVGWGWVGWGGVGRVWVLLQQAFPPSASTPPTRPQGE